MPSDIPIGPGKEGLSPELIAIFSEEAEEKALGISRLISAWRDNREDVRGLVALQMRFSEFAGIAQTLGLSLAGQASAEVVNELNYVIAGSRSAEDSLEPMFEEALHSLDAAIEWLHGEEIPHAEVFAGDDVLQRAKPKYSADGLQAEFDSSQEKAPTAALAERVQELPDVDASLFSIFLEECEELLAAADGAWETWQSSPSSNQGLPELKRHLHTIKGGARMVGLMVYGEVVHELETQVVESADDAANAAVIRQGLDVLLNAYEKLANGQAVTFSAAAELSDSSSTAVEPIPVATPEVVLEQPSNVKRRQREVIRVPARRLDEMRRHSSNMGAYRSRVEQLVGQLRGQDELLGQLVLQLQRDSSDLEFFFEQSLRQNVGEVLESGMSDDDMDRIARVQLKMGDVRDGIYRLSRGHENTEAVLRDATGLLSRQGRAGFELAESLMSTRLVPISDYSARLKRIVRQACETVSSDSQKEVSASLKIVGERLELDRALLERILGPLEHLLRNSVAHGIEPTTERSAAGKSKQGAIELRFEKENGQLSVVVVDDGRGIDAQKIRQIAITKQLISADDDLTESQLQRLIFRSGFSSAEGVSQVSGRGVGMDVVETEVRKLGGTVSLQSTIGKGAEFSLALPLGLSTVQGISVAVGAETYAVPFSSLTGVVRLNAEGMRNGYDGHPILFQNKAYQMVTLAEMLGLEGGALPGLNESFPTLIVDAGESRIAVVVDRLLETDEFAVQALPPLVAKISGLSGAVVMGDGEIVPIVDLVQLHRDGACRKRVVLRDESVVRKGPLPTLLVIDANNATRKQISQLCSQKGFEVEQAKDGAEGLEALENWNKPKPGRKKPAERPLPSLIILDIDLPRVNGPEVLKQLAKHPRFKSVPVAVVSAISGQSGRLQARKAGAAAFLDKKFIDRKLLKMIKAVLEGNEENVD